MHKTDKEEPEVVDYTKPIVKKEKSVKTSLDKWLDAEKAKVDQLKDKRKVVGGKTAQEDGEVKKVDPPKEEKTIDVLKK